MKRFECSCGKTVAFSLAPALSPGGGEGEERRMQLSVTMSWQDLDC
jgi:hypothetical protein